MGRTQRTSLAGTRTPRTARVRFRHIEALVDGQSQVLEMMSQGQPLPQILDAIARWVEAQSHDGVLVSLLLLAPDGQHLLHGAGPNLPADYNSAINGLEIGPRVGSCGTAAFTGRSVIVEDLASDPLWGAVPSFRELALAHELRACWSTPLLGSDGRVLGTFAMYYHHPRLPSADDLLLIRLVTRTAALAIEHKHAEEEREHLRASEQRALRQADIERERLQELVMRAPEAIALLRGPEHVYELANEVFIQMIGRGSDVLGKPVRAIRPELAGQGIYELLDQIYASGEEHVAREMRVRLDPHATGELEDRYLNVVYQPRRDETGVVDGILIHAVDVTELVRARQRVEESEQRFRTLADNISQLAWIADGTGRIFWFNQRWYDYTGTTLDEMQGWGWQKVHHPDHVERVVAKIRACFESGELWEDLFPLRGKDGEYRWFLSRAVPVRDAAGKVTRWFGTNTDVTERRQLDQQKDDFIATASHELKTPVTSVKMAAQMLARRLRQSGDLTSAEVLDKMDSQLNKLTKLIGDLLDQTRIERGKLQLQPCTFDYGTLVTEVIEDVQRTAPRHAIRCEAPISVALTGDRERIGQVLTNLLTNAVKYSPDADRVVVTTALEGGEVVTRVQDFGMGIPPEKQAQVFDRYFRVTWEGSAGQDTPPGLGLGLYISAEIVRQHGGRMWLASEVGQGSTFAFALPIASGSGD